jgi:hypothetical protein
MANDAVSTLKAAADAAYDKNPDSCSNAVWDVLRAIDDPKTPYRTANTLIDYMVANWTEVSVDKAAELANAGVVVVGGKKEKTNGHVVIVYPGVAQASGGYAVTIRGKQMLQRSHGKFPPVMSTSINKNWPGTMSRAGEKTVWDPWGDDTRFAEVKFWTPNAAAANAGTSGAKKP